MLSYEFVHVRDEYVLVEAEDIETRARIACVAGKDGIVTGRVYTRNGRGDVNMGAHDCVRFISGLSGMTPWALQVRTQEDIVLMPHAYAYLAKTLGMGAHDLLERTEYAHG